MKTIAILIPFLCFLPLWSHEIQKIAFHELSDKFSEEKIEIRGFIYVTKEGTIILAKQPDLKSCCVGSSKRAHEQIVLYDIADLPKTAHAVSVRGIFHVDPTTHQNSLTEVEVLQSKRGYPLTILAIASIFSFIYFGTRKFRGNCKTLAQSIFERFCQDLPFDPNSHTPKSRVFGSNGKDW